MFTTSQNGNGVVVVSAKKKLRLEFGDAVTDLEFLLNNLHKQHMSVLLDLENMPSFDSSGIGAIINMYAKMRANGQAFAICNASRKELEYLTLTRLIQVLPIYATKEDALQAYPGWKH